MKEVQIAVFVFIILFCLIFEAAQCEEFKHSIWSRNRELDGYEFDENIVSKTKEKSPVACAMKGSEHDDGKSLTFSKKTSICVVYSSLFTNKSDGYVSTSTVYREQQSLCDTFKAINRTIANPVGVSRINYKCDFGYEQSGSVTSSVCKQNGQWTDVDIQCKDCSNLGTTYVKRPNKYFNVPYIFANGINLNEPMRERSENLQEFKTRCNTHHSITCKAFYVRKSDNYSYGAFWAIRVYDDISYRQYYTDDADYDEFIRECL